MRPLIVAALVWYSAVANAEIYECPKVYPGKDGPAAPVTGGTMAWGEDRTGLFAGDYSKPAENGYDATYPIMADEQAWLVCSYGGNKRHQGKVRDGHEWNQYVEWGPIEWWVRLPPKVRDCTVHARETKGNRGTSTWAVSASCIK